MTRIIGKAAETVDDELVLPAWLRRMPIYRALAASQAAQTATAELQVAVQAALAAEQPAQTASATIQLAELVVDTFTTDGTWTRPAGVTSATVECWGAGGGGTINTAAGGGGAYARSDLTGLDQATYAVVAGTGPTDADGEDASFGGSLVVAKGGLSGSNGGTGGQASASTGDTAYDGGDGGVGTGNRTGGGSAGSAGAASGATPGEPDGAIGGNTNGPGNAQGGGGGSGTSLEFAGGRGEVRVSYLAPAPAGHPRIVSRSTGRTVSANTSHAITMPANIVAGNLLLLLWACDGDNDGSTDHTASGWTQLGVVSNGTTVTMAVLYKIATGSDTCTVTTTDSEEASYQVLQIANAGTPTMSTSAGTGANADPPSHDAGGSLKHLWLAVAGWDSNTTGARDVSAPPSGWGSFVRQPSGTASGGTQIATASLSSESQTVNPGAFTSASEQWAAATISVPPA